MKSFGTIVGYFSYALFELSNHTFILKITEYQYSNNLASYSYYLLKNMNKK